MIRQIDIYNFTFDDLAMKILSIIIELLVFVLVGTFGDCFNPKNVQNSRQLLISLGNDLLFKIFFFRNHKRRLKTS